MVSARHNKKNEIMRDYSKFYTPDEVADSLVSFCNLFDGIRVLEPSAGDGALVRALLRARHGRPIHITAVEINPACERILRRIANKVIIGDLLKTRFEGQQFDLVLANPPFGNEIDIDAHLAKMMERLVPLGELIFIGPRGIDFNKDGFNFYVTERMIENWSKNSDGTETKISIYVVVKNPNTRNR